jgi:hypothetical protein
MSGVHQIKEQNERILTLLGEQPPAQGRSPGESPTAAADTQPDQEMNDAHSD